MDEKAMLTKKHLCSQSSKSQVGDEAPTLNWQYDNVLLRQGYCTPSGAVIDEYWATRNDYHQEKTKNSAKNLLVSLRPPRISLDVARDWTRLPTVRGLRLAA
jgi:hypothetical protein